MKNVTLTKEPLGKSHRLIVDGEVWEDSWGSTHDGKYLAGLRGTSLSKVAKLTLQEVSKHFIQITLDLPIDEASLYGWCGWEFNEIEVRLDRVDDQGHVPLISEVYYEFEYWSNPYTIADVAQSMQDVLANHPEFPLKYWTRHGSLVEGFGVQGAARHEDTNEHVLLLGKDLLDLSKLVENHVFENQFGEAAPKSVSVLFSFPTSVKSACEQYLLYFGQFLSDLGIQTQTELAEKAARVLFSVTPIDATQALSQIYGVTWRGQSRTRNPVPSR